jgi:preprotein translocase subunit YajC
MLLWNLLADAENTQTDPTLSYIIMGVLIIAIIGLFVWQSISSKKKQKEAQEMVNSLKIGDRVKTIGGICGFVAQINDAENTFVLETGLEENKCFVKFDKGAIYQTAPAQGNAVPAPAKEEVKAEEKKAEAVEEKVEEKPAPAKRTRKKKATEENA